MHMQVSFMMLRAMNHLPPISSQNFLESVRYRAQNLGRLSGVAAAEGFTVERTPLIQNFDDIA